jgi:hypothetical protein
VTQSDLIDLLRSGVDHWNAWRREKRTIDLSGANLLGADLRGVDLRNANLREIDLRSAVLRDANLRRADLREADLSGADLCYADLLDSNLTETRLSRVSVGSTVFETRTLGLAKGLSEINHHGPSPISDVVLSECWRQLPRAFCIGIGMPDWRIESCKLYDSTLTAAQVTEILYEMQRLRLGLEPIISMPFISYSHADKQFATRLHDALQSRGVRCWRDEKDLLPGHRLSARIDEAIRLSDLVILVCSKNSLESAWVSRELEKSKVKERELWSRHGERAEIILPIDLDGFLLRGWNSPNSDWLRSHIAADFRDWRNPVKFEQQIERVVASLRDSNRSK